MSEPVDTSAEAVERVACTLSYSAYYPYRGHDDAVAAAAALLRALAKERAEQETLLAERNRDAERFEWFFGDSDKLPFMSNYLLGVRESWTPNQWRAAIDAAMGAREGM